MYHLHLEIDSLPKSLNKALRTHHLKTNSINKRWDFLIACLCNEKLPREPLVCARIRLVRHYYQTLDYDGLVGSMKPVVDGLVTAGVLKNDSWRTLGVWDVSQSFRPKRDGALLTVDVYEVDTQ